MNIFFYFYFRNYTYFTDLPIKDYTTEDAEVKTEPSLRNTAEIPAPCGNRPLAVMKLRGNKQSPHHIKQHIKEARELSEISESHCHTPCPSKEQVSIHKGRSTNLFHDTASGSVVGSDDRCPRNSNQKGGRKKQIITNFIHAKFSNQYPKHTNVIHGQERGLCIWTWVA